ncbi:LOW QUALITY PROTEIN: plasminogen receptor (KT) [Cyanocitta cristata]
MGLPLPASPRSAELRVGSPCLAAPPYLAAPFLATGALRSPTSARPRPEQMRWVSPNFLRRLSGRRRGGRRGVKVGGSQARLRPGAALLTLTRFPGSPPPCFLRCAAGLVFSKALSGSLKGQQEFLRLQLERQLVLQNLMRERQTAVLIAWTQEFLKYFGTFLTFCYTLTTGAIKRKNPAVLLPILLLSFVFSYQYDMGYGTLLQRIKGEEENILVTQSTLLELPKGSFTYKDLEKIRISQSKFFIEK